MVTVKLFGTLRLDSGVKEVRVRAGNMHALYAAVLEEIKTQKPDSTLTEEALRACLVAVNGEHVHGRIRLHDNDVIYLLSPVAGG